MYVIVNQSICMEDGEKVCWTHEHLGEAIQNATEIAVRTDDMIKVYCTVSGQSIGSAYVPVGGGNVNVHMNLAIPSVADEEPAALPSAD